MKFPDDFINKVIQGDCLRILQKIPPESISMVITSPPYWGLRDYGTGPDQLGLELTPELYIEHLLQIFKEIKRILKPEGTFWLNMGDTYGGSGQGSQTGFGDYKRKRVIGTMDKSVTSKIMPKCLLMMPEQIALELIQQGWILRNKIIWFKPNAMPSSVQDRFGNKWEYLYLFSKNQKYYFDLGAIREPFADSSISRMEYPRFNEGSKGASEQYAMRNPSYRRFRDPIKGMDIPGQIPQGISRKRHSGFFGEDGEFLVNPDGKNPGDVWEISTQPFPQAHFAVFPEKLCIKPIKAGCPEEVCKKCGKARKRIRKRIGEIINQWGKRSKEGQPIDARNPQWSHREVIKEGIYKTMGWTSCDCNAGFESGIVLDPFAGSGTIGIVAKEQGKRYILIEIKEEYCSMARKRIAQAGCQLEINY